MEGVSSLLDLYLIRNNAGKKNTIKVVGING
jgi:hypothetical protein